MMPLFRAHRAIIGAGAALLLLAASALGVASCYSRRGALHEVRAEQAHQEAQALNASAEASRDRADQAGTRATSLEARRLALAPQVQAIAREIPLEALELIDLQAEEIGALQIQVAELTRADDLRRDAYEAESRAREALAQALRDAKRAAGLRRAVVVGGVAVGVSGALWLALRR